MPRTLWADTTSQQAALQAQLNQINIEIQQNQLQLATQQKQRASLERDEAILNSQIKSAQLDIRARSLSIQQIKSDVVSKQQGIASLDTKVAQGEESIAHMMRAANEMDDNFMIELVLGNSLQDFFRDLDDFDAIQKSLAVAFTAFANEKSDLSARKVALEEKQQEQGDLLQVQVAQQASLKDTQAQKQQLITETKGQEALYQKVINAKRQSAADIEAQLFALRDSSKSVSFGSMYSYAKEASARTGVRPALILGILSEESNLGQNVGKCTYQGAMSPTRDIPDYLELMQELGMAPDSQKVSCAQSYGAYGGAMGPAQFIPSTWVTYQSRIAKLSGQNPPNPWDPRTATFATAILMMDNGAAAGTADAERLAALRYLAGWKNASKPAYAFYGNAVMSLAAKFESQIAILGN